MEPRLYFYRRPIDSVFALLNAHETSLTKCLGWALANSTSFCRAVLLELFPSDDPSVSEFKLEAAERNGGRTDVELLSASTHVIIEAKADYSLPTVGQLQMYAKRFKGRRFERIVTVSSALVGLTENVLPMANENSGVRPVQVCHLSWLAMHQIASKARVGARGRDRFVIDELLAYFEEVMDMQSHESNIVHVVPLGYQATRDFMNNEGVYWHPARFFKSPPTYMGFRWDGALRAIAHVDDYEIVTDRTHSRFLGKFAHDEAFAEPHYVLKLGPRFALPQIVKSGRIWAAGGPPQQCMLHTLLTCPTVRDAVDETKRLQETRRLQALRLREADAA
jgi:hypothetical protein